MQAHKTHDFDTISVRIASPEEIKQWAKETACHCPNSPNCNCGEVKKPETINYRTFRPERDGLFCEAIFGPTKDWECACGKYKRIKHKGVVCDRCGVEVTQTKVRRERMGYIQLAAPVSHIWFFKGMPSRIGTLLDISYRELERVIYFEAYVVLDPGDSPFEPRTLLSEEEYYQARAKYDFRAEMGAAAVRELLEVLDLKREAEILRRDLAETGSKLKAKKFRKRLKLIIGVLNSGNKPEWMILDVIPVIPPELRPLVPLDGGRFATSDLNDLYRRVINRNNRLKRLIDLRAPDVIIRNEKRMLQEAVDALLDNGRHGRQVRGPGSRPLKSLSDMLKGKPGRFRQNLLGKRVDYSGRSVIVIGPELQLHQCGLPKKMALELFKPFIIRKLQEKGYAQTIKSAKKMAERVTPDVWEVVEEVIAEHPVLLNRAPTLHRLGIQAFQPILVEGKAIRIHPLVCQAFNADFDGDQMAVHVPLSTEAQIESKLLMNATRNLLKPAHGGPIAVPDLDVVLGCNYLTKLVDLGKRSIPEFSTLDDALYAYACGHLGVHALIKVLIEGVLIETSIGRVVFNQIVPDELTFIDKGTGEAVHFCNQEFHSRELEHIVAMSYEKCGSRRTVQFLDQLKELGFHYATISGISIAMMDMLIPDKKAVLIEEAQQEVDDVEEAYREGEITQSERYNKIIAIWGRLTDDVQDALFDVLGKDQKGLNPVHIMADSGARSKKEPIRQIAGMRGLMTKPSGEIIERPIFANFREGLSVLQYFISTHGARKGLADTAIKTASSGYLTRKLVDVAQDVIVTEEDCGTLNGITKMVPEDEAGEPLSDKIFGRVVLEDVSDRYGEVIAPAGTLITRELADKVEAAGVRQVRVRSVLTCESNDVCRQCYGSDLSTGRLVDIGESIGIIAAQSIGEPGTQLTMRTFHTGGAVSGSEEAVVYVRYGGVTEYHDIVSVKTVDGDYAVLSRNGYVVINDEGGMEVDRRRVPYGSKLLVADGDSITADQPLMRLELHHIPILTEQTGTVEYIDIIENVTVHQEIDETTGQQSTVVIEYGGEDYQARIQINIPGKEPLIYRMPTKAHIAVRDGDQVAAGDVLARIPQEASKARDIVMGLPRVTELFEARKPKEHAIISDINGVVRFHKIRRGMQIIQVVDEETGIEGESYRIRLGKHIIVQDGDLVRAGDPLTDGAINPHDFVRVKGEEEVQAYLVDEVQRVYRAQGEMINDKHIEVIIRQMMRKVEVRDPGDTDFLEGDEVMRTTFDRENRRVIDQGGQPATARPILQGITKAALSTDSFISAASFQQTTNVLTRAAVNGLRDNLRGLKENVIMGRLIPAGTGVPEFRQLEAAPKDAVTDKETAALAVETD